jgi:hypothetical protein
MIREFRSCLILIVALDSRSLNARPQAQTPQPDTQKCWRDGLSDRDLRSLSSVVARLSDGMRRIDLHLIEHSTDGSDEGS